MSGLLQGSFQNTINKFRNDSDYRELVKTSFYALLVRVSGIITGFLVTIITTRYFGADALGIVSICIAILSFSSVFGKMGLDVALMKYIAGFNSSKDYSAIKQVYIEALKLIIPVTLLISVLLYFLSPWMAETLFQKAHLEELLKINAWLSLPLVLLLINSEGVRGLKKIKTYTFLQTVSVSLGATLLLIIAYNFLSGNKIPAMIQFVSITLSGILSLYLWLNYSGFFKNKSSGTITAKELYRFSSPMFTTTLMQLTMSWAATLIMASFVSEAEVGIYNALIRISVVTNITILAINSLALPRFAEAYASKSFDTLKRHAIDSGRLIFLTSLPLFVLLAIFPEWVLSIFGKEFPGNEKALYVLLAGQFIVCFSGLPSQLLNMTGGQRTLRNISIFSAIVNVICCFLLIPHSGIMGACYAQLAGTLTWNLLSIIFVKRHLGFTTYFKFKTGD
jgi:O-antigen/teichoic acid export membrane protein